MSGRRNKKKNRSHRSTKDTKNSTYTEHVDYKWFTDKVDGHGGSLYTNGQHSLAHIGYIGHKNSIQVFGYNVILFFKYLNRVIKNRIR